MSQRNTLIPVKSAWCCMFALVLLFGVLLQTQAHALTLSVTDTSGQAIPSYRWLVEEDVNWQVDPAAPNPVQAGLEFHKSYMPVVAEGSSADLSFLATGLDPSKHYFISILPDSGYAMSGGQVKPGQGSLTVAVQSLPTPTAQISFFVFEDTAIINDFPDLPAEKGLPNFKIMLEEPAGKYGQNGGPVFYDAFGNFIGTTYLKNPDGTVQLDGDGNPIVDQQGQGYLLTDANGFALAKYLVPAKYGTVIQPPNGTDWIKTTTIEGTRVIDAWVKANENRTMVEFGIPTTHVFAGYVRPFKDSTILTGGATVTGQVSRSRMERPPGFGINAGAPFPDVLVGLNAGAGTGPGVFVGAADPATGVFQIPDVPPGTWEVMIWDKNLDIIFLLQTVTVPDPAPGTVDMGQILVNDWFAHTQGHVFYDTNENGFKDPGEAGIPNQVVNIRWRDGTVYQSTTTNLEGFWEFHEIFPFFDWLVLEVDFARYKATGATIVVDGGTAPNAGDPWSFGGEVGPQPQPENGNLPYRVEKGPVLTQGMQAFAAMHNVVNWGKTSYGPDENGGISGIVFYDLTRAEDDPRYGAGETWQPGIARIQVNLYKDANNDGIIDDINAPAGIEPADVDNHPLGWSEGGAKGPEDVDWNGNNAFDYGDAYDVTWTDSWDDNIPDGCPGNQADPFYLNGKCYDGLRNYNQVRPAVFDGGYAFGSVAGKPDLPTGIYIVEVVEPLGSNGQKTLKIVKSQDKNVDFGETYVPSTQLLPPVCVGDSYVVPAELSLFPGVPANLAGQTLKNCDRKVAEVVPGRNAAADFFLHTQVPIASHFTGLVNNDLANTMSALSVNFQEKFGAPYVPVALRDWTGREITRVYTDKWGVYNGLIPGSFSANVGNPSGFGPVMYTVCVNDAGPMIDPVSGNLTLDPFFRREFSQSCYNFQWMPGSTTYLDTPMLSTAAFASRQAFPLDCELPDGTPIIYSAEGSAGGAYVPAAGGTLTITSQGSTTVKNPAHDPINNPSGPPATIIRDYGFGSTKGDVTLNGVALANVAWNNDTITGQVPAGTAPGTYQLMVTRNDNGKKTVMGLTVTVGPAAGNVIHVTPAVGGTPIQDAIDAAADGDLILVHPGTYFELVVMHKKVQLQGSGAPSTVINAMKAPSEKLDQWQIKVKSLVAANSIDLLPGQDTTFGLFPGTGLFASELGPGILVVAKNGTFTSANPARIDGISIVGADSGGGILVNGYADYLEIANNRLISNHSTFGGGIRMGHPVTTFAFASPVDSDNDYVKIHHNQINMNGNTGGNTGGGVAIYTGCDFYEVTDNYICGNFSIGSGAGIGHMGLSDEGLIARNDILFNQSFHQTIGPASGGGISIEGILLLGQPTAGAGSVTIDANLIQGNFAGAGDGGAIRLFSVNGQDVLDFPGQEGNWHRVDVTNNMIVNNVTALAGAVSLADAVKVNLVHNTIAHNDSVATGGAAVDPGLQVSIPQPSGIVSRAHSTALAGPMQTLGKPAFSDPSLINNIIWENRSFYYSLAANGGQGGLLPLPTAPVFDDLGVLGVTGDFTPVNCILTGVNPDPLFVQGYFNGAAGYLQTGGAQIGTGAALDEGGNFIDVEFGPVQPFGSYHILSGSSASNAGSNVSGLGIAALNQDFDAQNRTLATPDVGADEIAGGGPALDTVFITSVTYDAVAKTLQVVATSSAQPGVQLTASSITGGSNSTLGTLVWKAANNFYRTTFQNVAARPDSVIVTSSGGGSASKVLATVDTVTVTSVTYNAADQKLVVVATSSAQPNVQLTAAGYGPLAWKGANNFYRNTFTGVAQKPQSVTVTSSGGGSATYSFPVQAVDTVVITNVTYNAANQTLVVTATSSVQPNAVLTATGYGKLDWKGAEKNFYRKTFNGVAVKPADVTVVSSVGGSATRAVP